MIYYCDFPSRNKKCLNTCERSELLTLVEKSGKPLIHQGWAIACGQPFEERISLETFKNQYVESYYHIVIEVEELKDKILVESSRID
jgi:hypothetical protein